MRIKRIAMVLPFCVLAAFPVGAQAPNPDGDAPAPHEHATPAAPDEVSGSFGPATQDYVVHSQAFVARQVSPRWIHSTFQFFGNDTATAGQFGGTVDLPAGARITRFECHFIDASALGNISAALERATIDVTTSVRFTQQFASVSSAGNTGFQVVAMTLPTPETVRYRNGNERYIFYILVTTPADTAANVSFRDCIIEWNRQVSPAPATATFPNDVPTSHPFFRFIEALAASGITSGCAAGSYCPDAPVTRGQMAVFLSAALGLHFPN